MPVTTFQPAIVFDFTRPPDAAEVRTSAPPRKKPGPKPRGGPKPKKKKPTRPARRRLAPHQLAIFIDNVEGAIEAGVIDLHPDFEDRTFLDLTRGELELLVRILYPAEPEQGKRLAELRGVLERATARKARKAASGPGATPGPRTTPPAAERPGAVPSGTCRTW